ncbi:hypothetical protein Sango_2749700 [Sesamum angolense]|uniref:HhH-GPD domain-containing protein n=1 Tax=Sesamum angolense TaxID=2727404 RepID=A0AAE1T834_9LAMI|nr:hypothetical protein Sango_2749700 [Sesamum angolense]
MEKKTRRMIVAVGENFNLENAVCNHGFFMMPPNLWIPTHKSLTRPLRLSNHSNSLNVSITQPPNQQFLLITPQQQHPPPHFSYHDREAIRAQVVRMLRISAKDEQMVEEFHRIHPDAKKFGFARIFRSPTLFEDIVKSILLCNCTWGRSLEMAEALCDLQQHCGKKGSKRKRRSGDGWKAVEDDGRRISRNFPSPKEIACLDEETLNGHCNLGYRASIILDVARNIENGSLNLGDLSDGDASWVRQRLLKIKGFGPFTVANIMMCLGFYQNIPVDTETIKHLEEVHGKTGLSTKTQTQVIAEIYDKYDPFQCLAYWMEHVEYYEKRVGKLSELPHSQYRNVTTTNFRFVINSGN